MHVDPGSIVSSLHRGRTLVPPEAQHHPDQHQHHQHQHHQQLQQQQLLGARETITITATGATVMTLRSQGGDGGSGSEAEGRAPVAAWAEGRGLRAGWAAQSSPAAYFGSPAAYSSSPAAYSSSPAAYFGSPERRSMPRERSAQGVRFDLPVVAPAMAGDWASRRRPRSSPAGGQENRPGEWKPGNESFGRNLVLLISVGQFWKDAGGPCRFQQGARRAAQVIECQ